MTRTSHRQRTVAAVVLALSLACGRNVFKSSEKEDPAETATMAMERNQPDTAISILQNALSGDAGNPQYLSILSTAYALRAGVDPLLLASKIAASKNASLNLASSDSISSLFGYLPEATDQNLADVDQAVTILTKQIPAASRQPGDVFKTAIYLTASLVLHTKALNASKNGTLTKDDIAKLSNSTADLILNNLSAAQSLLASKAAAAGASPTATAAASQQLATYAAAINATPGDTSQDKLRNYLAAHPGAASSAPGSGVTSDGAGLD